MVPVVLSLPVLMLSLASGAIRLLGDPGCPDPKEVRAQLAALNPALLEGAPLHLALVQLGKDGLEVRLFAEDGSVLEQRVIAGSKNCVEWARTAAVMLVAWEAELAGPGPSFPVAPPPSPPPAEPPRPVMRPKPTTPVPTEGTSVAQTEAPGGSSRQRHWHGEIGAGVLGSVASDGAIAPGIELRAALDQVNRPYGVEAALLIEAPRSVPLGGGSVRWERFALGFGTHLALESRKLRFEIAAEVLAGLLVSTGVGFTVPRSASAFDPGLMVSTRVVWRGSEKWLLWLQMAGLAWLRSEQAQSYVGETPAATAPIPRFELLVIAGFSFRGPL